MEVEYLKDEKNEATIKLDNPTVAEIMRVELVKDSAVKFAAWRKEHPEGNKCTMQIRTSGKTVKKAISDASASLEKQLDKFMSDFKKSAK